MRKIVKKTLAVAALAGSAVAASTGVASAKPLPSGPGALGALTGLSALDRNNGEVDSGSPLANFEETNLLNLMSDHSRHQTTGTSGNQG